MSLQSALDALADALSLSGSGSPGKGEPLTAALEPAPAQLTLTELTAATLKATWISKDVLFSGKGPEAALRQSPPDLAALDRQITGLKPYLSNLGTFISPSGTPGLVGQLLAELPALTKTDIPVSVNVKWSVTDDADQRLDATQFKIISQSASSASFLFAPQLIEATGGAPPTTLRRIHAGVTLTAKLADGTTLTNTNAPKPLALDIPVPALPVPTMVALFNHAPFDLTEHGGIPGCVLVCVPPNSPYRDIDSIIRVLAALNSALSAASGAFARVAFLADTLTAAQAVGRLADLLRAVTDPTKNVKLVIRGTGSERYLDKIIFYVQVAYWHTASDTFGSLFMVGMPSKAARFYNDDEFNSTEGAFTLRLPADAIAAVIETLHDDPPSCAPATALDSSATSDYVSPLGRDTFGDRISSFEFL